MIEIKQDKAHEERSTVGGVWLLTEHGTLINLFVCGLFFVAQPKNAEGDIEGWMVFGQSIHAHPAESFPVSHRVSSREEATALLHRLAAKLPGVDVVDFPQMEQE